MPYYNQPEAFKQAQVEDNNKFATLPFYLVKNEVPLFAQWNIWDRLFGSITWKENMGPIMEGVTPQPSAVGEVFFFPKNVTEAPYKNIYEVQESTNTARLKWHRYESFQFNFVPSFQSFWSDHISYAQKDIVRQIAISNNFFIRTNVWFTSPRVIVAGTGLIDAPIELGNDALTTVNSKTSAWVAAQLANVQTNLSLRVIYDAITILTEDIKAPAFEGQKNMPENNKGLEQKYLIIGSSEAWLQFPFDPSVQLLKSIQLDLLFGDFKGLLFGTTTFMIDPYPIRIAADGTFPPPEVIGNDNRIYVNPNYKAAPFEIAFILGDGAYKSIKIGPPPAEFAATKMPAKKFFGMRWNGEVQLTDQILIQTGSIAGGDFQYELNRYGLQLQLISQAVHGILAGDQRNLVPIMFRRQRVATI